MANAVRVRVELKRKYNDPHLNFKEMFQEFKRRVNQSGVLHEYKEHQYFESKAEKDRRLRNESLNKFRMETLEKKILAGEKVKAPNGLVKKIISNLYKKDKKDKKDKRKDRKHNRHHDD